MSEEKYILKKMLGKMFFIFKFISKVEFFCVLILLYIFILLIGTIEQKNFGLQFVRDSYFNSNFIIFFNIFPMLGGKLISLLIFLGLIIRLCFDKWNKKRLGTIFLHVGVLFLFLGAFVDGLSKIEGHVIIKEHDHSNFFVRNDLYDLSFLNKISMKQFNNNISLNTKDKTFVIDGKNVLNVYKFSSNCILLKKKKFQTKSQTNNINRFFFVNEFPSFVEQEENRAFLLFNVTGCNDERVFSVIDYCGFLNYENNLIKINLSRKNERLPFDLYLSKFEKINYSGTKRARNYISNFIIENNNIIWRTRIEMNKPLRINNYTLYQTSFLDGVEKSTILTIVESTWGFYPYVSTIFIFFGFLTHLVISFKRIRIKNE